MSSTRKLSKEVIQQHIEQKFSEWLDNTDENNLGIIKWTRDLLPEWTYNNTPEFHKTMLLLYLSLFDPLLVNRHLRQRNVIVFRGGGKSTVTSKELVAYLLANNGKKIKIRRYNFISKNNIITAYEPTDQIFEVTIDEKLIVIASKTATMAESIVTDIRNAFQENERLRYYYRYEVQDAIDSETGEWTKKAFRLNDCYVLGTGAKQQIRGKIKGASRPTLLIFDDIYDEENVSAIQRAQIKQWFDNAALNTVDDLKGKTIVINTIVHEDTMPVILKNNPLWKTIEIPVMPLHEFIDFAEKYLEYNRRTGSCRLPFEEIENEYERLVKQQQFFAEIEEKESYHLAWKERINLYKLALHFTDAVHKNNTNGFFQEYFHLPISEENKRIRKEQIIFKYDYELKHHKGKNYIKFDNGEWQVINIEFGVDLAAGGDETVISPVGALSNGMRVVFPQIAGKFGLRDELHSDIHNRLNKVCLDYNMIAIKGVIDEMFRQYLRYKPSKIKIGIAGEEKNIVTLTRQLFESNYVYDVIVVGRPQTVREKSKVERILDGISSYFQSKAVIFVEQDMELIHQLEYLGKAKNDDRADALEVAFWQLDTPISSDAIDLSTEEIEFYTPKSHTQSDIDIWKIL